MYGWYRKATKKNGKISPSSTAGKNIARIAMPNKINRSVLPGIKPSSVKTATDRVASTRLTRPSSI